MTAGSDRGARPVAPLCLAPGSWRRRRRGGRHRAGRRRRADRTPPAISPGDATVLGPGPLRLCRAHARHLLIFDYQERRDGPQPRVRPRPLRLDRGWVDPAEIARDRVRVFVSHSHEDHFDPVILGWRKAVADIAYYFGWKAAEDPAYHYLVGPRGELHAGDGLEISTINSHHSGVPEVACLVKVDGLAIYHNGDYRMDYQADFPYLQTHVASLDLAFVLGVSDENIQYGRQNRALFERFKPRAVFPMHAEAGARMYKEFAEAFSTRLPGLQIVVPRRAAATASSIAKARSAGVAREAPVQLRARCAGGRVAGRRGLDDGAWRRSPRPGQQTPAQASGASPDVFTFVRALDEAASRNVWPGFEPSRVPLALFDGERTVLLRHPSPPPEFTPWPDHPGALVVNGRHPAVAGNSTREIGGVRTATVIATLSQSVESTTLAVVEEVFHVFWLARHPVFRPDEMARYGYPLDAADNQRAILAEDEALARAIRGGAGCRRREMGRRRARRQARACAGAPGRCARLRGGARDDGRHGELRRPRRGGRTARADCRATSPAQAR